MTQRPRPALDWPGIVAELYRQGMTLTELAERNGLPAGACRKVPSQGHYKAQEVIAKFLGYKPEELWPKRYPKGKPRILDTNKFPPVASQKGGAETIKRQSEQIVRGYQQEAELAAASLQFGEDSVDFGPFWAEAQIGLPDRI